MTVSRAMMPLSLARRRRIVTAASADGTTTGDAAWAKTFTDAGIRVIQA